LLRELRREVELKLSQLVKRVLDVTLATAILIVTLPLTLVVALLILILEGRPIFYISRRHIGPAREIPIIKFRSMVRDATSPKYRLKERFMRKGYLDIPRDCEVYTPVGRLLERLQIVELPQLLNVIWHGMSLIGNRPLPAENVRLLRQFEGWAGRFDSPSGISGITQVVGKLGLQPSERLALEIAYSECYQSGRVLRLDCEIFLYTVRFVFLSRGIPLERAFDMVGVRAIPKIAQPEVRTSTIA
jgi:lipopolysaccharide/colanic/teichoic acid biosynthesis glycosyltransferase